MLAPLPLVPEAAAPAALVLEPPAAAGAPSALVQRSAPSASTQTGSTKCARWSCNRAMRRRQKGLPIVVDLGGGCDHREGYSPTWEARIPRCSDCSGIAGGPTHQSTVAPR